MKQATVEDQINSELSNYKFDQYLLYPSKKTGAWKQLFLNRVNKAGSNSIDLHIPQWDEEHFGFKVGKINNPFLPGQDSYKSEVETLLHEAKKNKVKVLILRMNGDNLKLLHEFEKAGFHYYETIIWPVTKLADQSLGKNNITLFDPALDDVEEIINIARHNQFPGGHFQRDNNFEADKINDLYAKWIKTAISEKKPIAIIKNENKIAGYFIYTIDEKLSGATGYKYGVLQSLALDSNTWGKGLGKKLFEGTLSLLKEKGCDYTASSYASKNHISAMLHSKFGFYSVYEEVTMHLWL